MDEAGASAPVGLFNHADTLSTVLSRLDTFELATFGATCRTARAAVKSFRIAAGNREALLCRGWDALVARLVREHQAHGGKDTHARARVYVDRLKGNNSILAAADWWPACEAAAVAAALDGPITNQTKKLTKRILSEFKCHGVPGQNQSRTILMSAFMLALGATELQVDEHTTLWVAVSTL